jgi:hypothetical protein
VLLARQPLQVALAVQVVPLMDQAVLAAGLLVAVWVLVGLVALLEILLVRAAAAAAVLVAQASPQQLLTQAQVVMVV